MAHLFTSDPHFNHINILQYCSSTRPYGSVDEMNESLVKLYCDAVTKDDDLWFLGDIGFGDPQKVIELVSRIPGKKHLIVGNHDKKLLKHDSFRQLFSTIDKLYELRVDKQLIVLCHYKMAIWNQSHRGAWHLFGHSHGSMPEDHTSLSFDVGVDAVGGPMTFDQVKGRMSAKTWKPIDHHHQHVD